MCYSRDLVNEILLNFLNKDFTARRTMKKINALIIGNSDYCNFKQLKPLVNCTKDASFVHITITRLCWTPPQLLLDIPSKQEFSKQINTFASNQTSKVAEAILIYFCGLAFECAEQTFLCPVNTPSAVFNNASLCFNSCISTQAILDACRSTNTNIKILFFVDGLRFLISNASGLPQAPSITCTSNYVISFPCKIGEVPLRVPAPQPFKESVSVYAKALSSCLYMKSAEMRYVFNCIHFEINKVVAITKDYKMTPIEIYKLEYAFYLNVTVPFDGLVYAAIKPNCHGYMVNLFNATSTQLLTIKQKMNSKEYEGFIAAVNWMQAWVTEDYEFAHSLLLKTPALSFVQYKQLMHFASALHIGAVHTGSKTMTMVDMLLNFKSVNFNAQDAYQCTPLHYACVAGNTQLVKILLDRIPVNQLNTVDCYGNTPLHIAAAYGYADIVALLKHVDRDCVNMALETPYSLACLFKHYPIIQLLQKPHQQAQVQQVFHIYQQQPLSAQPKDSQLKPLLLHQGNSNSISGSNLENFLQDNNDLIINANDLTYEKQLGSGTFGDVWLLKWIAAGGVLVAGKKCSPLDHLKASIMKEIQCLKYVIVL